MSLLAYLDPGSGSVLLQALLGGVAALAITGKLWWHRLLTFLRIRKEPEADPAPEAAPPPDESRTAPSLIRVGRGAWPRSLKPRSGSFRDPDSRVFRDGDEVLRALSARGLEDWERLRGDYVLRPDAGRRQRSSPRSGSTMRQAASTASPHDATLRHERIPFVSYPYEWPFSMLREAALLELELLRAALAEDMILEGRIAIQRPVAGLPPGVHRCRLVRAPGGGRALGRLSPVLQPVPLSAHAPGLCRAARSNRGFAARWKGSSRLRPARSSAAAASFAAAS